RTGRASKDRTSRLQAGNGAFVNNDDPNDADSAHANEWQVRRIRVRLRTSNVRLSRTLRACLTADLKVCTTYGHNHMSSRRPSGPKTQTRSDANLRPTLSPLRALGPMSTPATIRTSSAIRK